MNDSRSSAERMARIVALAEFVWKDPDKTRLFLALPHPELGGKTVVESAQTEAGARQAEHLLVRILYRFPA